jgi:hypothetical protein
VPRFTVAGAQDAGQSLAASGLEAEQRVEAVAAFVGAGGALLLRMGAEQCGVDVEDEASRGGGPLPGAGAGRGASATDACERGLVETLQAAVGGGVGGDVAEEHLLVTQHPQVGERVAAVGEHHGEVADDAAWFVAHFAGVHAQGLGQPGREAELVGQAAEQRGAGARGQAVGVGDYFQARSRRSSVHLHGDPPGRGLRV